MTDRWWDGDPTTNLALVDGGNPGMGVGVAVLGFHAIAKAAMSDLASQTLVDRGAVEAVYDHVDVEPVRKAIAAATTEVMGPVAAGRYADLVIADWLLRGREASSRLTATLVAKGLPWPRAVSRTSAVAGVPLERLGRYATVAATPGLDPLSAADAADRVLMDYAASRGALEFQSAAKTQSRVSKASQERSRTHEDVPWDEQSVKRDEGGRFASEGGSAAAQEAKDRLANRAARKKRAAKKAKRSQLTAAPAAEQVKQREAAAKPRGAVSAKREAKASERTALKMDRGAAQKFRERAGERKRSQLLGEPPEQTHEHQPFNLRFEVLSEVDFQNERFYEPFRTTELFSYSMPTNQGGASLYTPDEIINSLLEIAGPEDQTRWVVSREWLNDDLDTPPNPELKFDPQAECYTLIPTEKLLADPRVKQLYMMPNKATPVVATGAYTRGAGGYLTTPISEVEVDPYSWIPARRQTEVSVFGEHYDRNTKRMVYFDIRIPAWQPEIVEPNWNKAYGAPSEEDIFDEEWHGGKAAASVSRKRSAEHEQWDESLVARDAQGQFATQDAEAMERKARLANRKRRRTRKARRQQLRERAEAQAAATRVKAANHPAGKGREAKAKERGALSKPRASKQERRAAVASSRPAKQKVRAQSIPPGLPVYSRKTAPMTGPYALSEPLYAMADTIDPSQPLTLMTEQRAQKMAADHFSQPSHKSGTGSDREYLEPRQEPYPPILHRFEAGTVPLSGQLDDDMFSVAWPDELGSPWTFGADRDSDEVIRFVIAAPGPKGKRDWRRGSAQVVNLVTDFTVAEPWAGGKAEVDKRSRERDAENEPWDESKINRDSQGQFASSETEAMKKARKARRKRREARRKRQAQRSAQTTTSIETAKPRGAKARERGAVAMKRAARASKRGVVSANREATAMARERTAAPVEINTVEELRKRPEESSIGQWLGSTGTYPTMLTIKPGRLPKDAADKLSEGKEVVFSDLIDASPGDEERKARVLLNGFGGIKEGLADRNSMRVRSNSIQAVTQQLGEEVSMWSADQGWAELATPVPYGSDLTAHATWGVELVDGEHSGLAGQWREPDQRIQPLLAGHGALRALAKITAMSELLVNDERDVSPATLKLAQQAWDEYRGVHDQGAHRDVRRLSDEDMWHVVITLADSSALMIEPLDDPAWDEAVVLGLNKGDGAPIRLDDKGVFKITSIADTHNGWRPLPGKQAQA